MSRKLHTQMNNPTNFHFPYKEEFEVEGKTHHYEDIINILAPYISEERKRKIDQVISERTFGITTVLEKLCDEGNINAVMRSSESLGFSSMHIVSASKIKRTRSISKGSDKWVDIHYWEDIEDNILELKKQSFQVIATHLNEDAVRIDQIDFSKPTAIIFGSEQEGVSKKALELADQTMIIPMKGFSQSFNISVASAITYYHIAHYRQQNGLSSELNDRQKSIMRASYYLRSTSLAAKYISYHSQTST